MDGMDARGALRALLTAGRSMEYVDWLLRQGLILGPVHGRFARLFAWGTATDHPLTRAVPLERWRSRRERVRRAVANLGG